MLMPLELLLRVVSSSVWVALSSYVRVALRSQETNFETKIFSLGVFLALPTETSFNTPHYCPKYEVWAIENFFVVESL